MTAPGTLLAGRYELRTLAGRGGMAEVWKGVLKGAAQFETEVAVKRMLPSLATDPALVTMFVEEAKIASLLTHPNVTRVFDLGADEGGFYLVMEWVEGIDLSRFVRSYVSHGELPPWSIVLQIVIDALRGLASAHDRVNDQGDPAPVIHRDVDPQNILVGINGVAKLTDFGLAFAVDRARLTQPGTVKGKLGYVAPEILDGREPTAQSDLYGMGVVLWESLAGERLFLGQTDRETFVKVQEGKIPPLTDYRRDLPPSLHDVLASALAKRPEDRVETADELYELLEDVLHDEAIRPSPHVLAKCVAQARARTKAQEPAPPDRAAIAGALFGPGGKPKTQAPPVSLPEAELEELDPVRDQYVTPEVPLTRRK
ncbi:MAG: serine/threonine-protein kinase [Sandaracinus sp.]